MCTALSEPLDHAPVTAPPRRERGSPEPPMIPDESLMNPLIPGVLFTAVGPGSHKLTHACTLGACLPSLQIFGYLDGVQSTGDGCCSELQSSSKQAYEYQ